MGIMLTFMFLVNMLGAILLLPALAAWLLPERLRTPEDVDRSELDSFIAHDKDTCIDDNAKTSS
jgi:hypothetical protein